MIEGVIITPLKQFFDERGKVMPMIRSTDKHFMQFGEIYFSCVYPNAIKAWHSHKLTTLNYAVPHGQIKFVLFDDRPDSTTRGCIEEFFLSPENYCLVTVPPLIWNGFKGIGFERSIVANCSTLPHDPTEIERRGAFNPKIPYDWGVSQR